MQKKQISFQASGLTLEQLEQLKKWWGGTLSDAIMVAVDRAYREESARQEQADPGTDDTKDKNEWQAALDKLGQSPLVNMRGAGMAHSHLAMADAGEEVLRVLAEGAERGPLLDRLRQAVAEIESDDPDAGPSDPETGDE